MSDLASGVAVPAAARQRVVPARADAGAVHRGLRLARQRAAPRPALRPHQVPLFTRPFFGPIDICCILTML